MKDGPAYASIEARSMLAGAAALVLYARGCVYLMGSRHWHASPATLSLLPAWLVMALGLWALSLR
jgi:hypothetical protein